MAVVGIIALLAMVGVPAIKGLTGSGGRKQALAQVLGAFEVARNTAISTGTNAAVIFPDATFSGGEAYKYRSMAVVAWNPTISTNPTLVGSWIVFPQGIYLLQQSIKSLPIVSSNSVRIVTQTNTANCPGIVFQSDGALSEDFTPLPTNGIAFHEGLTPPPSQTNFETVRLFRYTGRAMPTYAPAP